MTRHRAGPPASRLSRRGLLRAGAGLIAAPSLLAGCGGASNAVTAGGAHQGTIGLVLNGFNVYDQCLATGVLKELEGSGYDFVGLQGNFDAAQEVSNFDTMLSKQVDGIIVIPNTVQSVSRGALAAKNAGVPVVNLLWSTPTPADDAFVARIRVDNIKGGNMIAQWISENTDPGAIVVVGGVPGQGFAESITQGLTEGLQVYGDGKWQIVGNEPGLYTRTVAIKAAQNLLTAHPKAKIIVDYAAEMGNGIASFLKQRGRDDIVHITSDGNEEMVPFIREGWIKAVRYFAAGQNGIEGARQMRRYLDTKKPASGVIDLKQGMVTKESLDKWLASQPLCYGQFHQRVKDIG